MSDKFNSFTDTTYSKQYKGIFIKYYIIYFIADSVYILLENFLNEFIKDGDTVMEIGAGATCPATCYLSRNKKAIVSYIFEPSAMADSAKKVVGALPVKDKDITENAPGERPYYVYQLPAHQIDTVNPPKVDALILNRMLHEWRLYEIHEGMGFNLQSKINVLAEKYLKPNGIIIIGDFQYQPGISNDLLKEEMEALRIRIGIK
jgi:predicted methyltransferase